MSAGAGESRTYEFWARVREPGTLFTNEDQCSGVVFPASQNRISFGVGIGESCQNWQRYWAEGEVNLSGWRYLAGVIDRTMNHELRLHVDGAKRDVVSLPEDGQSKGRLPRIGSNWNGMDTLFGDIASVRVSGFVRSEAWIAFQDLVRNDTVLTYGSIESISP